MLSLVGRASQLLVRLLRGLSRNFSADLTCVLVWPGRLLEGVFCVAAMERAKHKLFHRILVLCRRWHPGILKV